MACSIAAFSRIHLRHLARYSLCARSPMTAYIQYNPTDGSAALSTCLLHGRVLHQFMDD